MQRWRQGCKLSLGRLEKRSQTPNFGLKVFMDARMPVTHEEGDRYPLGPPSYGDVAQLVEQRTENSCVTGSIPVIATRISFLSSKVEHTTDNRET